MSEIAVPPGPRHRRYLRGFTNVATFLAFTYAVDAQQPVRLGRLDPGVDALLRAPAVADLDRADAPGIDGVSPDSASLFLKFDIVHPV